MTKLFYPSKNTDPVAIYSLENDQAIARNRIELLKKHQNPTDEELKEIGKLEYYLELMENTISSRRTALLLYQAQLTLNFETARIEVFYNTKAEYYHNKVLIGFINSELEFIQILKKPDQFKNWTPKNCACHESKISYYEDSYKLSKNGTITYRNKFKKLTKEIINLKNIEWEENPK